MRTIAICNLKGGVGKTTLTFNLAASFAALGRKVLLIDADAQGSLTECLDARRPGHPTLADVLRGQATIATAARRTDLADVSIVSSSPVLDRINHRTLAGERVLLARMHDAYDFALIDCAASTGVVLLNAFIASDEVLAPVQAHSLARHGILRLVRVIRELRDRVATPHLDLNGIVVNQFDPSSRLERSVLESLRKEHGSLVLKTVIHDSESIAETTDARLPIGTLAPNSASALQIADLAKEIARRSGLGRGHFDKAMSRPARPQLLSAAIRRP